MVNRTFFIGLSIFLFTTLIAYSLLGGFSSPKFEVISTGPIEIIGLPYSGNQKSDEAESVFFNIRSELNENLGSHLVIVNYPSEKDGEVNYFIGISPFVSVEHKNMERRELQGFKKVIRIKFNKHNLVMPKPFRVREMAEEYAASEGLTILDFTIEHYLGERQMEIDFPVK